MLATWNYMLPNIFSFLLLLPDINLFFFRMQYCWWWHEEKWGKEATTNSIAWWRIIIIFIQIKLHFSYSYICMKILSICTIRVLFSLVSKPEISFHVTPPLVEKARWWWCEALNSRNTPTQNKNYCLIVRLFFPFYFCTISQALFPWKESAWVWLEKELSNMYICSLKWSSRRKEITYTHSSTPALVQK